MAWISAVAYDYQTGKILFYNEGDENSLVFPINQDWGWAEGKWDAETHYILNAVATPRPRIDFPKTHRVELNTDWVISGVPEGTYVDIDGEFVGTVDDTDLTLSFSSTGVWKVTLIPPFPWIEVTCEVTVT